MTAPRAQPRRARPVRRPPPRTTGDTTRVDLERAVPGAGLVQRVEALRSVPGRRPVDAPAVAELQHLAGNRAVQRLVAQRDAAEITHMSITEEYARSLSPEQVVERLKLLETEMGQLDARGARYSHEYSSLYTNRRLLRDALGALGRTAEQEMIASRYRMPPLTDAQDARLRLAIGGTRAYDALEHREALGRQFGANQRRGWGIANATDQSRDARARADEELARELANLGVGTPQQLVELIDVELPAMVLARAKDVALGMLDENEQIAQAELDRYGTGFDADDVKGLQAADHELRDRSATLPSLTEGLQRIQAGGQRFTHNQSRGMGILNVTQDTVQQAADLSERVELARSEFELVRTTYAQRYPVLAGKDYVPGMFVEGTPQEAAARTGAPLRKVLSNIEDVREDVNDDDLKVWSINRAISTAMLEMGIAGQPVLVQAVQRRVAQHVADESFRAKITAILLLGVTLLSGPLAPYVGMAVGAYYAAKGISAYAREAAADNVALDPEARDISVNEPDLVWLIIDIAGAAVDLGAVLRALRPLARAAIASGRIAEFAATARRVVPEAAERLVMTLRQRLQRGATAEGGVTAAGAGAAAAAPLTGAGRTLGEYLDAVRAESSTARSAGRWDHVNQPRGLPNSRWEPGMPIDMPNTAGAYPTYDVARPRYWRNRAHFELAAREAGVARQVVGDTLDPVRRLSDQELTQMRNTGRAPAYQYPNTPGQTWELEHGVPQRVGKALEDLGLSRAEAARLSRASDPGNLMEVSPLEHAFFDAEAHGFGRLRADASGIRWPGTVASDARLQNALRDLSDTDLRALVDRTRTLDFTRTPRTQRLRTEIQAECAARNLGVTVP